MLIGSSENGQLYIILGKEWPIRLILGSMGLRRCIQKFPDWVDTEINNNNNNDEHSLRSNTKCYGGKTH
jgi:hypothetical protein